MKRDRNRQALSSGRVMDNIHRNFGLVIAFLLPGLVALWGISSFSPTLTNWLAATPGREPTVGSFLYVALASLAIGLIVSAVRWSVVDTLHHATGIKYPDFDFSRLQANLDAFVLSVEWYYRYYQFYANMFVAVLCVAACRLTSGENASFGNWAGVVLLDSILFAASRDSLARYYSRVSPLLGTKKETSPAKPQSTSSAGESGSLLEPGGRATSTYEPWRE